MIDANCISSYASSGTTMFPSEIFTKKEDMDERNLGYDILKFIITKCEKKKFDKRTRYITFVYSDLDFCYSACSGLYIKIKGYWRQCEFDWCSEKIEFVGNVKKRKL